jgi:hypothetical protein
MYMPITEGRPAPPEGGGIKNFRFWRWWVLAGLKFQGLLKKPVNTITGTAALQKILSNTKMLERPPALAAAVAAEDYMELSKRNEEYYLRMKSESSDTGSVQAW